MENRALESRSHDAPKSLKVLIVEDAPVWRERLVALLRETTGVGLLWVAESLAEAREVLGSLRPDLAVLDLQLPDGTGLDLLREIRAVDDDLFAVVLTAFDSPRARQSSFAAGANAYLPKTTGLVDLAEIVRDLVNEEPGA